VQDSLALVDLYNSTDGPNWGYNNNWLTAVPISEWDGIYVSHNRVVEIMLADNKLKGALPASLGNLVKLGYLDLQAKTLVCKSIAIRAWRISNTSPRPFKLTI
jgi:hypothetical protein